jgi:hypothetical protein
MDPGYGAREDPVHAGGTSVGANAGRNGWFSAESRVAPRFKRLTPNVEHTIQKMIERCRLSVER